MAVASGELEGLRGFIEVVKETQQDLDDAGQEVRDQQNNMENTGSEIESEFEGLRGRLEEVGEETEELGENVTSAYSECAEHGSDHESDMSEAQRERFNGFRDWFDERIREGIENTDQRFTQLSDDGFGQVLTIRDAVMELIAQLIEQGQQSHGSLEERINNLREMADEAEEQTTSLFEEVQSTVTENLASQRDQTFEIFRNISQGLVERFSGDLTSMASDCEGRYDDQIGNAGELAQNLIDNVEEVMSDVGGFIIDDATQRVIDGVQEAVEQFIADLVADMIESAAMAAAGAAVTGALGPFVPALVAAKNIVGTINDLLDALNPFG